MFLSANLYNIKGSYAPTPTMTASRVYGAILSENSSTSVSCAVGNLLAIAMRTNGTAKFTVTGASVITHDATSYVQLGIYKATSTTVSVKNTSGDGGCMFVICKIVAS